MLKVGLTGGVGSGKTLVSDLFRDLGVPVIDTDLVAREVVLPGSPALAAIVSTFGAKVLDESGVLERKRLRNIVFSDPDKRKELETILHPRIRTETLKRLENIRAEYCIIVVPLLIETDFVKLVDRVLVVDAPDAKRIQWIKSRDGLSEREIHNVFVAQTSREKRLEVADYILVNGGTVKDLRIKVADLHRQLLADSRGSVR